MLSVYVYPLGEGIVYLYNMITVYERGIIGRFYAC